MGSSTEIPWCDATFNMHWGCEKPLVQIGEKLAVSPECVRCYAETWDKRCGGSNWGKTAPRRFFGDKHWDEPHAWNRKAEKKGERFKAFCMSMGDLLEDRRDLDPLRERLWPIVRDTPMIDWLFLTKRHDMFRTLVPDWVWELPNVLPGITAGTQITANLRIPSLHKLKAAFPGLRTWVSMEPMLEAIDLEYPEELYPGGPPRCCNGMDCACMGMPVDPPLLWGIDQIVVGGESGSGARPMEAEWARDMLRQCRDSKVAYFFKQGSSANWEDFKKFESFPADLQIREFPEVSNASR